MAIIVERSISDEGDGQENKIAASSAKCKGNKAGWSFYQGQEVKGIFEELDGWIRRKLRCLLWRQWKRTFTRAKNLMQRGLEESRAWKSATNGRGAWWNSGASHMNEAFQKSYFDGRGLMTLLNRQRKLQFST